VIADQKEVLDRLTQGVPEALGPMNGAEAFDDANELTRVSQFLTTVEEIERLTGLDFGEDVRRGDVRAGEEHASVADVDEIDLRSRARRPPRRPAAKRIAKKRKRTRR
jgi:endonuclease G